MECDRGAHDRDRVPTKTWVPCQMPINTDHRCTVLWFLCKCTFCLPTYPTVSLIGICPTLRHGCPLGAPPPPLCLHPFSGHLPPAATHRPLL